MGVQYLASSVIDVILNQQHGLDGLQSFGYGLDGLRIKSHNPGKDDDRHADLNKFSWVFFCECGVWIRFSDL